MDLLLHQILAGLATGGIYASVALALVMIYQATHLVNFAQGEMAMFATYLAWALLQAGVPYWGAVRDHGRERVRSRRRDRADHHPAGRELADPGHRHRLHRLLVIFNSVAGWIFSYTIKPFPSPFPASRCSATRTSRRTSSARPAITLVVLLLLFVFFRFTPLGLAMRAAAQNPVSSRLVGIRVGWMLALGWGLAAAIGAIAGMMVAPTVFLEPNMMGGVLLYAFAGACSAASTARRRGPRRLHRRRARERRRRLRRHRAQADAGARSSSSACSSSGRRDVRSRQRGAGLAMAGLEPPQARSPWRCCSLLACALPFFLGNYRVFQLTLVLAYAIALLGLNMLTGYNGQISLGHGAFYAIGAYTAAILMDKLGSRTGRRSRSPAPSASSSASCSACRRFASKGLYLALATFALGVAMPQILKHEGLAHWTGGSQGVVIVKPDAPAWSGLSQDQWLYFFTLPGSSSSSSSAGTCCAAASAGRWCDPGSTHCGAGDGRQYFPREVADVRRLRPLHRRGRRARRDRRSSSWRPIRSASSCRSPCWSASSSAAWPRSREPSSVRSSSSSFPTSPTRSPRPRRGRSTASS
jgi:branched-chain amino acid transport system permease protein